MRDARQSINNTVKQLLIRARELLRKMIYDSVLNDIHKAFSSFKKPSIIYAAPESGDISKVNTWQFSRIIVVFRETK